MTRCWVRARIKVSALLLGPPELIRCVGDLEGGLAIRHSLAEELPAAQVAVMSADDVVRLAMNAVTNGGGSDGDG
jgi:hypothetical protein